MKARWWNEVSVGVLAADPDEQNSVCMTGIQTVSLWYAIVHVA